MKLGIIAGWEESDFLYVQKKGLEAIEFTVNHNIDADEFLSKAEEIRGYSEKYNIFVGSIGRWGMTRIDENGEIIPKALSDDKAVIQAASIIGCPVFQCGVNFVESKSFYENCQIAINYLGALIEFAKDKNVQISTYNCDWENFVIEPTAWKVVHTALPELGIKYDASHCLRRGGNYLAELRDWGDRVTHVHIKGALYIDGEHYDDAPAGLDGINWGAHMDLLYTKNYNGVLSIEPHSSYWEGAKGEWGIDFTINFIRPYVMPDNYEA